MLLPFVVMLCTAMSIGKLHVEWVIHFISSLRFASWITGFYDRNSLFWMNKMLLSFLKLFSHCVLVFHHQQLIHRMYCNCLVIVKFIPRYIVFVVTRFYRLQRVFLNLCICSLSANLVCFRCLLRMITGFSKMNYPTLWKLYQKSLWILVPRCFTYCSQLLCY